MLVASDFALGGFRLHLAPSWIPVCVAVAVAFFVPHPSSADPEVGHCDEVAPATTTCDMGWFNEDITGVDGVHPGGFQYGAYRGTIGFHVFDSDAGNDFLLVCDYTGDAFTDIVNDYNVLNGASANCSETGAHGPQPWMDGVLDAGETFRAECVSFELGTRTPGGAGPWACELEGD